MITLNGGREMKRMPLYYGDNGVHEFWESTDHEVLIFRNHGEKWWIVTIDGGMIEGASETNIRLALDKAVQMVGKNLNFDRTHYWVNPQGSRKGNMVLRSLIFNRARALEVKK